MSKVLGYRRPYFDTQPALLYPGYRSTIKRAPSKPLVLLPHTISEVTGPLFGPTDVGPNDHDLTAQHEGAPIGERIVVSGRVLDENSKPAAYPWRNHYNAWRPAHLHFSLFGLGLVQRLVTQMYFPDDPLLPYDPMYNSIPNEKARERLISQFDWERTMPDIALAYRFDIVLRGREDTPMETSR